MKRPILVITVATSDGEVLEQFWTDEDSFDVRAAIQNNVACFESEADLNAANEESDG